MIYPLMKLTPSIITLNVIGLNTPIKSQRLSCWINKQTNKPYVAYKKPNSNTKIKMAKSKSVKNIYSATNNYKSGLAIWLY